MIQTGRNYQTGILYQVLKTVSNRTKLSDRKKFSNRKLIIKMQKPVKTRFDKNVTVLKITLGWEIKNFLCYYWQRSRVKFSAGFRRVSLSSVEQLY